MKTQKELEFIFAEAKAIIRKFLGEGTDLFLNKSFATFLSNKDLRSCTASSIIGTLIYCAKVDLTPCNIIGDVFVYTSVDPVNATLQAYPVLGYKGVNKLIMRTGKVSVINAGVIYKDDIVAYELGTDPFIKITSRGRQYKDQDIDYFYSYVKFLDGTIVCEMKPFEEIEEKRAEEEKKNLEANKEKGFLSLHFKAMGQKYTLQDCVRYIPISEGYTQIMVAESKEGVEENILEGESISESLKGIIEVEKKNSAKASKKKVDSKKVDEAKDKLKKALNSTVKQKEK